MKPVFYTKAGQLTRYALACGYIERRGPKNERSVTLEQICSNGALRVVAHHGDGIHREVYLGPSLKNARAACYVI